MKSIAFASVILVYPCAQIGAPALCKNCLSVGASQINTDQVNADSLYGASPWPAGMTTSSENLVFFSSRGPTLHDGRFKPDIVAPGERILSMSSKDAEGSSPADYCAMTTDSASGADNALAFADGTSMSTPLVAGAMEYVRQYFIQGFYPSGTATANNTMATVPEALLRAVILAGSRQITGNVSLHPISGPTVDLPSSYPNYAIGFGLPVVDRALYMTGYTGSFANGLQVTKPTLPSFSAGATAPHLYQFKCGAFADKAVHVVLTWTDPAGNPVASNQIVNDLDLVVLPAGNGSEVLGNNRDFPDTSNTVEKVALSNCGASGQVVRVAVNPARVVFGQRYALVVNGNVEMGSLASVAAGTFSFDSKRLAPLAYSASEIRGSACSSSIDVPFIADRLSLGSNPSEFAVTFSLTRFFAALAMFLGVGLDAFLVEFVNDFATVRLSMKCSSYVCGSSSSVCYVSANDMSIALLNTHNQRLAMLPVSNPLSIVRWVDARRTPAPAPIPTKSASHSSGRSIPLLLLCFLVLSILFV